MIHTLSVIHRNIKRAKAFALFYSGITNYLLKRNLSGRILILTYHRVLPNDLRSDSYSHQAIMVDPRNFEMHIKVIMDYFHVIDINTLEEELKIDKKEVRPKCLITFDDGWQDNFEYAYKILKKYNCLATIFVPADFMSTERTFWQERLGFIIGKAIEENTDGIENILKSHNIEYILDLNENEKQSAIMNYVRSLKSLSYQQIDEVLTEFYEVVKDGVSELDKHMSWEQLNILQNSGIQIESHACSHKILPKLSPDKIRDELVRSKSIIEKKLGKKVVSVAYPNGDYTNEVGELAKEAGYKTGLGTTFGYIDRNSDKYNLKRININDGVADSKPVFLATLLGLF